MEHAWHIVPSRPKGPREVNTVAVQDGNGIVPRSSQESLPCHLKQKRIVACHGMEQRVEFEIPSQGRFVPGRWMLQVEIPIPVHQESFHTLMRSLS
jgi:hypothetical protein